MTQGNFANHIALKTQVLDLGPKDRVLQQSSLGFDMSLVQTFCALANGGCLVVVPRDARRDPVALTALLREHAVSLTIATPSEYLAWLHYGDGSLRDHVGAAAIQEPDTDSQAETGRLWQDNVVAAAIKDGDTILANWR